MTDFIEGYVARFNDETIIDNDFRERIARGAFARSLSDGTDIIAVMSHDAGRVLGRTSNGTLRLHEDVDGLFFRLTPDPSTPDGQTAIGTVRRRDITGCSFGFYVREERWLEDSKSTIPLRELTDIAILEVTLTPIPAYESTSAELVSAAGSGERAYSRAAEKMRARGISLHEPAKPDAERAAAIERRRADMERKIREGDIRQREHQMRLRGIPVD